MAAVSQTIVREYFEAQGFLVRQHRKYIAQTRTEEEDDIDFFVLNPNLRDPGTPLPFVLGTSDLGFIERAIVVVKGWHTETFSASRLTRSPRIFRFAEPKVLRQAVRAFGRENSLLKLLVLPSLPQEKPARDQSIDLLKSKGVDAVLPFRTMLADLIRDVRVNHNYQKSDLLQILRILKNYDFFKDPELELFKTRPQRAKSA
jgi:hypothetical protein